MIGEQSTRLDSCIVQPAISEVPKESSRGRFCLFAKTTVWQTSCLVVSQKKKKIGVLPQTVM